MKKRISSGRYGLTRGLKKRLWSFYNSFDESTGAEGENRLLDAAIGSSGPGGGGGGVEDEFADVLMTEDDRYIETEAGVLLRIN
ncbi:hypothetical protein EBZ39_03300 [bacterium]|nr:hypothetical protein [bacterium]